jgi:hypothetical protein
MSDKILADAMKLKKSERYNLAVTLLNSIKFTTPIEKTTSTKATPAKNAHELATTAASSANDERKVDYTVAIYAAGEDKPLPEDAMSKVMSKPAVLMHGLGVNKATYKSSFIPTEEWTSSVTIEEISSTEFKIHVPSSMATRIKKGGCLDKMINYSSGSGVLFCYKVTSCMLPGWQITTAE